MTVMLSFSDSVFPFLCCPLDPVSATEGADDWGCRDSHHECGLNKVSNDHSTPQFYRHQGTPIVCIWPYLNGVITQVSWPPPISPPRHVMPAWILGTLFLSTKGRHPEWRCEAPEAGQWPWDLWAGPGKPLCGGSLTTACDNVVGAYVFDDPLPLKVKLIHGGFDPDEEVPGG